MLNLVAFLFKIAIVEFDAGLPVPDLQPFPSLEDAINGAGDFNSCGTRRRVSILDGADRGTRKKSILDLLGKELDTSLHQFIESWKSPGLLLDVAFTKDSEGGCHRAVPDWTYCLGGQLVSYLAEPRRYPGVNCRPHEFVWGPRFEPRFPDLRPLPEDGAGQPSLDFRWRV
jgi:hypothetical protein